MGVEYPVLLNMLAVRLGVASGTNISYTTLGLKLGIPIIPLNLAYIIDNKSADSNYFVFDMGMGI